MSIAPIRLSISVGAPPERAWRVFVREMGRWWPAQMQIGPASFAEVIIEERVGGRWFERTADGVETDWGDVLQWEPPSRLVLAWRIGADWRHDPELLTEVELTFAAEGSGTRVTLEHRNLEAYGAAADRHAEQLRGGWPRLLQAYANRLATLG